MTTAEVLDAISRERARLTAAVAALGERAATLPVTPEGWTAKDVLAHLVHYAGQVAFGLGAKLEPPPYVLDVPGRPSADEWNARAVAYYGDFSLEWVAARFERLVDELVARTLLRNDNEMNATDAIPWATGQPLWMFIGGDTFLHWPQHAADIERAARQ
jgi:hypothetical protein